MWWTLHHVADVVPAGIGSRVVASLEGIGRTLGKLEGTTTTTTDDGKRIDRRLPTARIDRAEHQHARHLLGRLDGSRLDHLEQPKHKPPLPRRVGGAVAGKIAHFRSV